MRRAAHLATHASLDRVRSAAVMYLDTLWTLEAAVSRSHGVLGAALTEPNGWPAGLQMVKVWAVIPCFVGLAAAVLPWGAHLRSSC